MTEVRSAWRDVMFYAAAPLALFAAWLVLSPKLFLLLGYEELAASYSFTRFYLAPVPVDVGTIIAAGVGVSIAALPAYIHARRSYRLLTRLDEQIARLVSLYAGVYVSSESSSAALERLQRLIDEPLKTLTGLFAGVYKLTGDMRKAHEVGFSKAPPRIKAIARSIVVATRTGANVHEALSTVASYLEASLRLTRLVRARLAQYSFIVLLAALTFAASSGVVLALVGKISAGEIPGIGLAVDVDVLRGLYFYSLVVVVLASSFTVARVVYGFTPLMARYLLMLSAPSTVLFVAFYKLI
ncbi:MAG: hypothetical protein ABWW70_06285 [Thermoproteota archaeon]